MVNNNLENQSPKSNFTLVSFLMTALNAVLVILLVCFIKSQDEERLINESVNEKTSQTPVAENILEAQNAITTDRENKLRDLNTAAKEIQQVNTTTTTTTTTPAPAADRQTKTS